MKNKTTIILILLILILSGVFYYINNNQNKDLDNNDPVEYQNEDENKYINQDQDNQDSIKNDDRETAYTGKNAELVQVNNPAAGQVISGGTIDIQGQAPGYWYFEAVAPVSIVNWDGLIIGEGYITAKGDWMTSDLVPFSGQVNYNFDTNTPYDRGWLILKRDNPSDLSENDASVEIPIFFSS